MMDGTLVLPTLMLLVLSLYLWRIAISVCGTMLVAWLVSKMTTANTAYFSYVLLVAGSMWGVVWQVKASRERRKAVVEGDDG
jgi:hypothetical protein